MKRLIVCCDGTWQTLSNKYPTNVVKISQAIKSQDTNGISQIVFYDEGIGTGDKADKIFGGAFGWGIDTNIQDAYRFLCLNYSPGDEIYLYGFSRGAYTVRCLAGFINRSGLLERNKINLAEVAYKYYRNPNDKDSEVVEFSKERHQHIIHVDRDTSIPITLLGCWDTVGALGVPNQIPILPIDDFINKKYKFQDTTLSSIIQHARHAVAIDENREIFKLTPMNKNSKNQDLRQVWFPGDHGCLGGGTKEQSGLSDGALQWMIDESKPFGLEFDESAIPSGIKPNPKIPFDNTFKGIFKLSRKQPRDVSNNWNDLHISVIDRWIQTNLNTKTNKKIDRKTNLPYNPPKLIDKHGVRLAKERDIYLARLKDENSLSQVG